MNERILELAKQVWPDPNISHANHLKFAELIIQECIDAVDKTNTHHIHTTFDDSMVRGTMAKTKTAIREHFGVES